MQIWCLNVDLDRRVVDGDLKKWIRTCFSSHAKYREKFRVYAVNDLREIDLSRMATLKKSERLAINFYEQVIFGTMYDATLKGCVRTNKTAAEAVMVQALKDMHVTNAR